MTDKTEITPSLKNYIKNHPEEIQKLEDFQKIGPEALQLYLNVLGEADITEQFCKKITLTTVAHELDQNKK